MANNTWSVDGFQVSDLTPNSGTVQCNSIDTTITATGSDAPGAKALVSSLNIITTCVTTAGVRLPSKVAPGAHVTIVNTTTGTPTVYPPTGGKINGGSTDAADALVMVDVDTGVPAVSVYVQDGTLTSGVPNYLRIQPATLA